MVAFPFFLCVCLSVSFDEVDSGMNLPICILTASLEALILDSVWQHTVVISLRKLQQPNQVSSQRLLKLRLVCSAELSTYVKTRFQNKSMAGNSNCRKVIDYRKMTIRLQQMFGLVLTSIFKSPSRQNSFFRFCSITKKAT